MAWAMCFFVFPCFFLNLHILFRLVWVKSTSCTFTRHTHPLFSPKGHLWAGVARFSRNHEVPLAVRVVGGRVWTVAERSKADFSIYFIAWMCANEANLPLVPLIECRGR